MAPKKAQKAKKPNSAVGLQNRSPSEAPVPATGGTITSADSPEALSPEESDAMFFEWCKLLDDRDMTILDFFQSLHKATHPATRDPSQCTPEQQAWMDEQAAEMKLQDEAELTGKSVQELALEKVVPIIQAEMEALESCGNFKSSKDHGLGDDFGFDKIQPLLEEMAPNLFEILMGAMSGATEDSEEQAQDSTPADDEASSEVSSARVVCSVICQLLYARNEECDRYQRHFGKQVLSQSADTPAEVFAVLSSLGMNIPTEEDTSLVKEEQGKGRS